VSHFRDLSGPCHLTEFDSRGDLGGTDITDAGLKDVAALTELTILNLSRTNLTDVGSRQVAALKKLTSLGLSGTRVTAAGVKELRKALPNCEIDEPSHGDN